MYSDDDVIDDDVTAEEDMSPLLVERQVTYRREPNGLLVEETADSEQPSLSFA